MIRIFALVSGLVWAGLCWASPAEAAFYYGDYTELRDSFHQEKRTRDKAVVDANDGFVTALSRYKRCNSNRWRSAFVTVIPEIDERRKALDVYKRESLSRMGALNSEWLTTFRALEVNRATPETDISEFVLWYENHLALIRQGPMHELAVYNDALARLSDVYDRMADACSGDPAAAADFDLVESGIRGLLDEVFSLIGRI